MQDHTGTEMEQREWDLKLRKLDADIELVREAVNKSIAETNKIITETRDVNSQAFWRPVIVIGGILAVLNIGDIFNTLIVPLLGQ